MSGTSGKTFDAEDAASRIKLKATSAVNMRLQPVEQGLPDSVGRWPDRIIVCERNPSAAPSSTDNSNGSGFFVGLLAVNRIVPGSRIVA